MIFLHNAGNDHHIWDHQMAFFSKTHEVFGIDFLGYGLSDRPFITDYSLPFYTDMLKSFIETFDLKDIILVGLCVGGAVCLNYTFAEPGRIKALALFNVATENTLKSGAYGYLYRLKHSTIVKKLFNFIAPKIVLPDRYILMGLEGQYGKIGEQDDSFIQHVRHLHKKDGHLGILNTLLMNFGTFKSLDKMEKPADFPPVMIVWGGANKVLRVSGGKNFAETFNPDTFVVFDTCGHLVMREKPDAVNQCMEQFFSQFGKQMSPSICT